ncbi:MAG: SCP-2 sterol transfer family protein [Gammaproteobacteria bacterium]|nr:MAG: SCP-2 sterol transfer family protein [Gammaproteobacteria bacterium]
MSELFDEAWMKKYQMEWNKDNELKQQLKQISFSSIIGYGFPDEAAPRGCIIVENGEAIDAGPYRGENLSWDLRAKKNHWMDWLNREVGKASIGLAWSTGKLLFMEGDYKDLLKDPAMSFSFIKSFSIMARAQ